MRGAVGWAAKQAGPGGRVRITLDRDDDQVVFRVEDSGPGVPQAAAERLFDPGIGEATSHQLATVAQIAQDHHGTTAVARSTTLGGMSLEVRLPVHRPRDDVHAAVMRGGGHGLPRG